MAEPNDFFHDSYQSPTALPGAYDEAPRRSGFSARFGQCGSCGRRGIAIIRDAYGIARAVIHPQKPNGQPDICR